MLDRAGHGAELHPKCSPQKEMERVETFCGQMEHSDFEDMRVAYHSRKISLIGHAKKCQNNTSMQTCITENLLNDTRFDFAFVPG